MWIFYDHPIKKNFGYLEKAHIKALVLGGEDHPCNIQMLCKQCHQDSELLDGKQYWIWFYSRDIMHVIVSTLARYNCINFDGTFNKKLSQDYLSFFPKT